MLLRNANKRKLGDGGTFAMIALGIRQFIKLNTFTGNSSFFSKMLASHYAGCWYGEFNL